MTEMRNQKVHTKQDSETKDYPRRRAGWIGGIGYIAIFVLAIFANFLVREGMVVSGDPGTTAANILGNEGMFRYGLVSFLAVFILDIFVAWAIWILTRDIQKDISLLAAWFRIVYTVFMGVGLLFYFQALQYLGGEGFLSAFTTEQLQSSALIALESFNSTWLIGLASFGVHLILLGFLFRRTPHFPRVLTWLMILSGIAYIVDTVAHSLLVDYQAYQGLFTAIVAIPSVIAEGWFGIWLLTRGGKQILNRSQAA